MLVAHIDDSGTDGSGPVFILAGYVADTNQWKRFSDQWQMALDLRPQMKRLKIQEALRLNELWGRIKPKERDVRMKRFASIIHKHVRFGIVAVVAWDTLRRLQKEFVPADKDMPYMLLYHHLMARVTGWILENKLDSKVEFIFDEQGRLGKIAPATFTEMLPDIAPELQQLIGGPPIHRSDEEVLPLQAAHTIAWLARRYAHEKNPTDLSELSEWTPTQPYLKKLGEVDMLWSWLPYERLAPRFRKTYEAARAAIAAKS